MTDESEPWDNSYVRDGDTETLLRRLLVGPLSHDQVVRSCLKEVHLLLSPPEKAALESKMTEASEGLLGGLLQPISNAIAEWQHVQEKLQQGIAWEDVPGGQRDLSEKRASYILEYASSNGWVQSDPDTGRWRITALGRELIERGGFYSR